ncbi:MAG: hypothetical protein RJA44_2001 [Pseudomonadota bacterium]|jgi:protein SCO1/2
MDYPRTPSLTRSSLSLRRALLGAGLLGLALCSPLARAAGEHDHHTTLAGEAAQAGIQRVERTLTMPAVTLTRQDGSRVTLGNALDDGRPVILNFIFTTCNAICPVTSQVFSEFRALLPAAERDAINMVSISIDPEQDTPRKLTAYAKRFGSAGTWAHYTGSLRDSELVQRAFEAWRGDKMNHVPQTFLRPAPGKPWIRIDGFLSPEGLLSEYRKFAKR